MEAHKANNHDLCIAENCDAKRASLRPAAPPLTRGQALARDLGKERTLSTAEAELARKAGLLVDITDDLAEYLTGCRASWLTAVVQPLVGQGVDIRVHVDSALSELRQQTVALKAVLGELRQHGVSAARSSSKSGPANPPVSIPVAAPDASSAGGEDEHAGLFALG